MSTPFSSIDPMRNLTDRSRRTGKRQRTVQAYGRRKTRLGERFSQGLFDQNQIILAIETDTLRLAKRRGQPLFRVPWMPRTPLCTPIFENWFSRTAVTAKNDNGNDGGAGWIEELLPVAQDLDYHSRIN